MKRQSTDPFDFSASYAGDSITIFDAHKGNEIKKVVLPQWSSLISSLPGESKHSLFIAKKYNASSLYTVYSNRGLVEEHAFFASISDAQKMCIQHKNGYKFFANKDAVMVYHGKDFAQNANELVQKIATPSVINSGLLIDNSAGNLACNKDATLLAYTTQFNATITILKRT